MTEGLEYRNRQALFGNTERDWTQHREPRNTGKRRKPGVHDGSVDGGFIFSFTFSNFRKLHSGCLKRKNKKGFLKDKGYNMGSDGDKYVK